MTDCDTLQKKILMHAINFSPEIIGCGKYTTELAQYLKSRGHGVEVITAPPHYPGWFLRDGYRKWFYSNEYVSSIKVTRCPMLTAGNGAGVWRLLSPLSFAITAAPILAWRICTRRPDILLCVEPTLLSSSIAMTFARLLGVPCVLHVQDLEVDAAFEVGHLRGGILRKVASATERWVLRKFDRIITISRRMRGQLISKGLDPTRLVVVRNWVNLAAVSPIAKTRSNAFRDNLGLHGSQYVVLYAGQIGPKQALDVMLNSARLLKNRSEVHFVIAGDGPLRKQLEEESADLGNVSFLDLQPNERLNELLAMADVHLLPQHKGVADLVLPSKLGGMLASGRPIIATVDPGTELFEMLSDIALLTPAGNSLALSETIWASKSKDLSLQVERGLAVAEHLGASRLLPEFEKELFKVLETKIA